MSSRTSSNGFKRIGVIGLGYVGLPLAIQFAKHYDVVGYDKDKDYIKALRDGSSPRYPAGADRAPLIKEGRLLPSHNEDSISECDVKIITVPTPITRDYRPDLTLVTSASKSVAKFLGDGDLVILESTTYPGTTREVVLPILEASGLKVGEDYSLAYSPERIDPGNKDHSLQGIPKIVGAIDRHSQERALALYETVFDKVIPVSSTEVAEAAKMLENIFRSVNIALVNEMALLCERMNMNVWEVISAASSKPFGFMPFRPGAGVGGHCIPVDPFYMAYRANQVGMNLRFVELSGAVNNFMPYHVVFLAGRGLRRAAKDLRGASVAILGLSYKPEVGDVRESPSRTIANELLLGGARLTLYDPFAAGIDTQSGYVPSKATWEQAVAESDCVIIAVKHREFKELAPSDVANLMRSPPVLVDTCNLWDELPPGVVFEGLGRPQSSTEKSPP